MKVKVTRIVQPGDMGWIPHVDAETPAVGGEEGKEDCNALWAYFMRHTTSGSGFNQLIQERKEGELEQE